VTTSTRSAFAGQTHKTGLADYYNQFTGTPSGVHKKGSQKMAKKKKVTLKQRVVTLLSRKGSLRSGQIGKLLNKKSGHVSQILTRHPELFVKHDGKWGLLEAAHPSVASHHRKQIASKKPTKKRKYNRSASSRQGKKAKASKTPTVKSTTIGTSTVTGSSPKTHILSWEVRETTGITEVNNSPNPALDAVSNSLQIVKDLKRFITEVGGVENAKALLEAAAEL